MTAHDIICRLQQLPPGVERDITLFRWKHANWPARGIFSTAHGGDCAGNLLRCLEGRMTWPGTTTVNGREVTLEYERNFNLFVTWLQQQPLTDPVFLKIRTIISDVRPIAPDKITGESLFTKDLHVDSLEQVEIIMLVEEAYDIDIFDEDLQNVTTVQTLVDLVKRKFKEKA